VPDLPRQLSREELAELFEGDTALVRRLAGRTDPLGEPPQLTEAEAVEALNAHPRIGERRALSARSAVEQGSEEDPQVLAELDRLNRAYEERFGFRFVVFVNGRPRSALVPVLRDRLGRTREQELTTGTAELVAIARDRWRRR
jgi:2-oxo-4-hydroxy-4-carboxy--5-ureidoimidazoline (OHCU) decarboxylase